MPPAVAQVPKLAKRIPEIDGLSDLGDVVSIDQKYAGVITMGPVFAPPSASGKALLDGPNHNVCPLGTWSAKGRALASSDLPDQCDVLVNVVYLDVGNRS